MPLPFPTELPRLVRHGLLLVLLLAGVVFAPATPANRAALEGHYDRFLAKELNRCTTCHLPSERKEPKSLEEFPHNAFGKRLRQLGEELRAADRPSSLAARLALAAREDSDGDGVANEVELLLGKNPGDAKDKPPTKELSARAPSRRSLRSSSQPIAGGRSRRWRARRCRW